MKPLRRNPSLMGKLCRISKLALLISKDRNAYRFVRAFVHHLSRFDELPPDQFLTIIINWSRELAIWQRNTIEPARREAITLQNQPKITIITPIFGSGGGRIGDTFESVARQYYQNWELYLLVDKKPQLQLLRLIAGIFEDNQQVKIKRSTDLEQDLGDIFNEVINESKGEFIGFLSGSDRLAKNALFEIVDLLNQYPDTDIIYSDQAEEDKENLIHLFYKPGWSRDLFLSMNYLRNFLCCRTNAIRAVGGFHGYFEDDIKYDLILRIIEKDDKVQHIPKVLYHEQEPKSYYPKQFTADYSFKLHKEALRKHIKRVGTQAKVLDGFFKGSFRVRRKILNHPKVSIIIATKDKADQLKRCIESIESKTNYRNFEIIIVDNASTEIKLLQYLEASAHKVVQYPEEFNFSKINNFGAQHAEGQYLLFLNDDTQVITPEWLEAMLEHSQREEVGIVGAKLLYPNGSIQHAGMLLEGNQGRHIHRFTNPCDHGYYGMADVVRNFNVVTGACLMIRKNVLREVGGFEERFATLCNDADLCLKVRSRGYLVVYTPYALLYHYEGISRWANLKKEAEAIGYFYSRWAEIIENDSYFNPNCYAGGKSIFWVNPFGNYYNAF